MDRPVFQDQNEYVDLFEGMTELTASIIRMRMYGFSWRMVSEHTKLPDKQARLIYSEGIEQIRRRWNYEQR